MISPQTDLKLAKGLRRLAKDQRRGSAPPPGEVSRADIARRAGVSEITIANIERLFAARLAAALLNDPSTPTNLIRQARLTISKL
jgi:transcriptional regulator with XRE-family HTH domain